MQFITKLWNKHKNQPIWIAGSDLSLDSYPDNFLDKKLAITLHFAYLKFPNTQYRYANELDRVRWLKVNRPEYLSKTNIFAWPFYNHKQSETEKIINPDNSKYYFLILRPNPLKYTNPEWLKNKIIQARDGKAIDFGGKGTCLHACIYVAIMMGGNPIKIIGCNHSVPTEKGEYFSSAQKASEKECSRNYASLASIQEAGTKALIDASKDLGIEIKRYERYNSNIGN